MAPKEANQHSGETAPTHQPTSQQTAAAPVQDAQTSASVNPANLILPAGVVSRSDVSKALREIDKINDYFHQASIRGSSPSDMPTLSRSLNALAEANQLNIIHADHRSVLKEFLTRLKSKAPVIHISFPSEASPAFIAKILGWFRTEVHPHVVLHVGLQPELAAGCVVRTTNRMFDFSLRKRFEQSKKKLLESIEALDKMPERTVIADANATVSEEARLS